YNVNVDPTCGGNNPSTPGSPTAPTVTVTPGGNVSGTDFTLVTGGSISATITTLVGSVTTPVANVCVNANPTSGGVGGNGPATASNGTYTISGLVSGTYNVYVDPTCGGSIYSTLASQSGPNVTVTPGGNASG